MQIDICAGDLIVPRSIRDRVPGVAGVPATGAHGIPGDRRGAGPATRTNPSFPPGRQPLADPAARNRLAVAPSITLPIRVALAMNGTRAVSRRSLPEIQVAQMPIVHYNERCGEPES